MCLQSVLTYHLQILDVHKYKEVPIISVTYTADEADAMSQASNAQSRQDDVISVVNTIEEQTLFHRLLELNCKRLPSELKTKLKFADERCNVSFLVPVISLNLDQVGKLASTPRCDLCGRLCSMCQSASYCGQGQWSDHESLLSQ